MNMFQTLEPRRLLAVDLTAAIEQTTLPSEVVVGIAKKRSTARVTVLAAGDSPLQSTGTAKVEIFLRQIEGEGILIGSTSVKAAALKLNIAKAVNVKLQVPKDLPEGSYQVQTVVNSDNAIVESDPTNNTATGNTVTSAAQSQDLSVSVATKLAGPLAAGVSGKVTLSVTNQGNITIKTKCDVTVSSMIKGITTTVASMPKVGLSLRPGQTIKLKATAIRVPGLPSEETEVQLAAKLSATLPLDPAGNNAVTAATFTVPAAPPSSLAFAGLGSILTFKTTKASQSGESGTFLASNGVTGTYTLATTSGQVSGTLDLFDQDKRRLLNGQLSYLSANRKLGGRAMIFGVDPEIGKASLLVNGVTLFAA